MVKSYLFATAIGLVLVLVACGPQAVDTAQPDLPEAVVAAEQKLSEELGIPVKEIEVASFSREEWPNACLGLAEPGEMCAQVITPGWRVVLTVDGGEYIFRTDDSGEIIRQHLDAR
jgi:hypothetical protein